MRGGAAPKAVYELQLAEDVDGGGKPDNHLELASTFRRVFVRGWTTAVGKRIEPDRQGAGVAKVSSWLRVSFVNVTDADARMDKPGARVLAIGGAWGCHGWDFGGTVTDLKGRAGAADGNETMKVAWHVGMDGENRPVRNTLQAPLLGSVRESVRTLQAMIEGQGMQEVTEAEQGKKCRG